MLNNTRRIYERLNKGEFLSADSSDISTRHLYDDVEENFEDYSDFFKQIGLQMERGNGYFYFSRIGESRQNIELKPIIHCWLSISQEPVDRANKLRHRTQRKSRSPIQEVRSVFISRDYKQIATRDGVNGFCGVHKRAR